MRFLELELAGAFVVELDRIEDERGFFARSWCEEEARVHGIETRWVQCNVSHNRRRGTLRGLHYQYPEWEAKLVRVTRGAIVDVIVDLRDGSPTRGRHASVELDAENRRALYVPEGFAHGFQTLVDDTEIFYQMGTPYRAGQARGLRHDDPALGINWPIEEKILSERDLELPGFSP